MNKLNLNSENIIGSYLNNATKASCTCYGCSLCLSCLIFAPLVAVFLSTTLGVALNELANTQ